MMTIASTPSETRPQSALLSDMQLPLSRTFYPLGFAIQIHTNHSEVLDAAEESFGHRGLQYGDSTLHILIGVTKGSGTQCPPEPVRRQYNHLYSIAADVENQALLDLRSGSNFVWLTECTLRNRLYLRHNFLEKVVYLMLGATVVTDIHSGCVSKGGKGILLCGDSGAGKSTLSYACARAGWTYISDDTCYLVNNSSVPRVIGHSHRVRFRPAAKDIFPELEAHSITPRMEGKPSIEVPVHKLPHIETATEAAVCAIVYLNRGAGTKAHVRQLPLGSAVERLSDELFSAGEIRGRHEQILTRLAEIPTFELNYTSLADAIEQLEQL